MLFLLQTSKKIADAKLAKDFQAILKEFQKAQRIAAERETAYIPFVPQAVLPSRWYLSDSYDQSANLCLQSLIVVSHFSFIFMHQPIYQFS